MSNEFGGRGRGTKRKVEQNSSTSSKKPRGELQTPALPGDAWVLMPNNLIRLYGIFRIFATQLLCILSYACLFESFYNTLFCNFWSDRLTSPEDGHFVTRLQLYSESSNISIQHNLILFEKIFLPICIFTYKNEKNNPNYKFICIYTLIREFRVYIPYFLI